MDAKKELETRQEAYAEFCDKLDKEVNSWADLYGIFHDKMRIFHEAPSRQTVEEALLTMYSFVVALEENPEESDANVLAKRMAYLLILEPEKLGANVTVVSREDIEQAERVLRAVGVDAVQVVHARGEEEADADDVLENIPADKRHFH